MMILLDMDEVLADFVGGALRVHGWNWERLLERKEPGAWSILEPMGLNARQFWEPINRLGAEFWERLEPTPWFWSVVKLVENQGVPWLIVSAPSMHPECVAGKIRWLRRYFGETFDRYVFTPHKTALARPDNVLIDDRESTIIGFRRAGGKAILFPCSQNRLYTHDPIRYLKQRLSEVLSESPNVERVRHGSQVRAR